MPAMCFSFLFILMTQVNMCAAAWTAGFQWRLWSESSSNQGEADKAEAAATSESTLAEAGAVLLVFTLAPSPPQPPVDAQEAESSSGSVGSSPSAATDARAHDDTAQPFSAPWRALEVVQRTSAQQDAFVSGLGPSFEAAVTATFPDVFESIVRAKVCSLCTHFSVKRHGSHLLAFDAYHCARFPECLTIWFSRWVNVHGQRNWRQSGRRRTQA